MKLKFGNPRTYQLTDKEKEEIEMLKKQISDKELAEREERERKHLEEEKEKQLEEINNQLMKQKKKELLAMEQRSAPVRHYLMKYVFPKLTDGILEVTKIRPQNPVQFLGHYLFSSLPTSQIFDDDDQLDEDVVKEFEKLTNCNQENSEI